MQNARLDEEQAGIKTSRRNINNLRHREDTTLMAESEEELKSLLIKVKKESEKSGIKLNIQKIKIMASSPISSWQIDDETMETVRNFIFLGYKVTAHGDCSHEKKKLASWRKSYGKTRLCIINQNITLPEKVCLVKAMVFPESCMNERVGRERKLSSEELMLLNCGVGEDS